MCRVIIRLANDCCQIYLFQLTLARLCAIGKDRWHHVGNAGVIVTELGKHWIRITGRMWFPLVTLCKKWDSTPPSYPFQISNSRSNVHVFLFRLRTVSDCGKKKLPDVLFRLGFAVAKLRFSTLIMIIIGKRLSRYWRRFYSWRFWMRFSLWPHGGSGVGGIFCRCTALKLFCGLYCTAPAIKKALQENFL